MPSRRGLPELEGKAGHPVVVRHQPDPTLAVVLADCRLSAAHLLLQSLEGGGMVATPEMVAVAEELCYEVALDPDGAATSAADSLLVETLYVIICDIGELGFLPHDPLHRVHRHCSATMTMCGASA